MQKTSLYTTVAVLVLTFAVLNAQANAQGLPIVGYPTTIAAGLFVPEGGATKYGGSNEFYVEARYGLPVDVPLTPTRTVVSIAAEYGDNNGNRSVIIPVTIGEYVGANGRSPFAANNFYGGVGLGVYIENNNIFSTTSRIGGYATVGYNVGLGFFVDAKQQIVEHGNGTLLGAGFRF